MQLLQFMKEDMELVIGIGERNFLVGSVENMHNEYVAKLSMEISRLSELIDEMKCRQPASEFLQISPSRSLTLLNVRVLQGHREQVLNKLVNISFWSSLITTFFLF
ncbi:hypothetical protein KIL84_004795 [Mauremys mutica]|uniref:Uncharacterized protein n=1 Tax=Mauremys mutica TaxID=74926 RepID=A0A9D3XNR5_9SAUR|nr:hypothetical protein KIL84_004795 [Mauremys mutica]